MTKEQMPFRIDHELKEKITKRAKQENRSRVKHIIHLIEQDVKLLDKYVYFDGNVPDRC